MKCPYCGSKKMKVVDKRDNPEEGLIRRRRECDSCSNRFTTYERIESLNLNVLKKDGVVEPFDRQKLERGILKAIKRDEISSEFVRRIVDDIQMELLSRKSNIVDSKDIGELVLQKFKDINPVAYMRFASVYKNFENLDDFENELETLKK